MYTDDTRAYRAERLKEMLDAAVAQLHAVQRALELDVRALGPSPIVRANLEGTEERVALAKQGLAALARSVAESGADAITTQLTVNNTERMFSVELRKYTFGAGYTYRKIKTLARSWQGATEQAIAHVGSTDWELWLVNEA
jgi:hypothetical protein